MAIYTEKSLALINQKRSAEPGKEYVIASGEGKGTLYRGALNGSLTFITNNFDTLAQNAVGEILAPSSSSSTTYDPEVPEIDTSVIQMNLGDVLAFAAAN